MSLFHILATSSKDDLHRRIGGRCSTNNMKIVFKVCCAPDKAQNSTTAKTSTISSIATSWPDRPTLGPISTPTTQYVTKTESTSTRKPTKKTGKQVFILLLCSWILNQFIYF